MAARKGMPSFTRGGMPVMTDPSKVHAHPKQKKKDQTQTNYAEPIAWGVAGGLTVVGGGLIAAGLHSGLTGGGGGGGRGGNKVR
jgi:hypothetical protein